MCANEMRAYEWESPHIIMMSGAIYWCNKSQSIYENPIQIKILFFNTELGMNTNCVKIGMAADDSNNYVYNQH